MIAPIFILKDGQSESRNQIVKFKEQLYFIVVLDIYNLIPENVPDSSDVEKHWNQPNIQSTEQRVTSNE